MVTKTRKPATSQLREWAAYAAIPHASGVDAEVYAWLCFVREGLSSVSVPRVFVAIAAGTTLNPAGDRVIRRSSWTERFLRVVIVTDNPDWLDARVQLAETVFGAAFSEFGHLPQYDTWSVERLKGERDANTPVWRALRTGVLLTGSLEEAFR